MWGNSPHKDRGFPLQTSAAAGASYWSAPSDASPVGVEVQCSRGPFSAAALPFRFEARGNPTG
jgi:hypothetical protein